VLAEASAVLRAVAADFFFNCWYLEIPSDNRIRHITKVRPLSCARLSIGVEFILRLTVSRPVRPGIGLPFGAHDQILYVFFFRLTITLLFFLGRPL
jgi:hypothetical protein